MSRRRTVPEVSIVTPAFNEAGNLAAMAERLLAVLGGARTDPGALTEHGPGHVWVDHVTRRSVGPSATSWEWIIVDDHSSDESFDVLTRLARREHRIRVIRLARNHGSFAAISCGLREARGRCAVVMASDLQDPPEMIPELLDRWRKGSQVVWAARRRRLGEPWRRRVCSRAFYGLMRRLVGMRQMPAGGADFFLLDRQVIDTFRRFRERSTSLVPLLFWMGFRQETVEYDKQARVHGRSGWSLGRKIHYALDCIASFSYLPIRLISYVGILVALAGFALAGYVFLEAFYGKPVMGYPSLMVAVLCLGGMQMIMLGVLGEYLWRTFDEVRGRPRFLIESTINLDGSGLREGEPVMVEAKGPGPQAPITSRPSRTTKTTPPACSTAS